MAGPSARPRPDRPRTGAATWRARERRERAKAAAGDVAGSRAAYEQFLQYWKDADRDLPVLAQARQELAGVGTGGGVPKR
jgi:hypothetical protein